MSNWTPEKHAYAESLFNAMGLISMENEYKSLLMESLAEIKRLQKELKAHD